MQVNGAGNVLSLTALNTEVYYNYFNDLEQIDLRGSGDNSLTLDKFDVLKLTDLNNELYIIGDAGDTLTVAGDFAGDWAQTDTGNLLYGPCTDYAKVVMGETVTICIDNDITTEFTVV